MHRALFPKSFPNLWSADAAAKKVNQREELEESQQP